MLFNRANNLFVSSRFTIGCSFILRLFNFENFLKTSKSFSAKISRPGNDKYFYY